MRTKDEILDHARRDIQDDTQISEAPLWLEYRRLEVLIDIRDILYSHLDSDQAAVLLRLKNP